MSFIDSLIVSINGFSVVFIVLVVLCFVVVIQAALIKMFHKGAKDSTSENFDVVNAPEILSTESVEAVDEYATFTGELKLVDCDEKTAAMIMAIISDESQIPLSQLIFKSIRGMD